MDSAEKESQDNQSRTSLKCHDVVEKFLTLRRKLISSESSHLDINLVSNNTVSVVVVSLGNFNYRFISFLLLRLRLFN